MTLQEAANFLLHLLRNLYTESEASAIADLIMESLTGTNRTTRLLKKNIILTIKEEAQLHSYAERLKRSEPVQYILGEAWFCGMKFQVDKSVLIPRPETEELVEWIISNCKFPVDPLCIIDIGTGSGCIPISLKRRLRKAQVYGYDICSNALHLAHQNSEKLGVEVTFSETDILNKNTWPASPKADIIVSNPPYIPEKDKESMDPNVIRYEPHLALFVPDDNALLFYRAIAEFGKHRLNKSGLLFFEIHEHMGASVIQLLQEEGYQSELKKDMQGKDRMVMAKIQIM